MSERYDYENAVKNDVREWVKDHADLVADLTTENRFEIEDELDDKMWVADSVTGNGSGSYTFSTWQAEENLCHNLDLVQEVAREFDIDWREDKAHEAEFWDVSIRCYLLRGAISAVLDELLTEREAAADSSAAEV